MDIFINAHLITALQHQRDRAAFGYVLAALRHTALLLEQLPAPVPEAVSIQRQRWLLALNAPLEPEAALRFYDELWNMDTRPLTWRAGVAAVANELAQLSPPLLAALRAWQPHMLHPAPIQTTAAWIERLLTLRGAVRAALRCS